MSEQGYINYFEVLDLPVDCKPGEVRKNYKKLMKDLVIEIAKAAHEGMTDDKRDKYLLDMARLNTAFYILRDNDRRERYVQDRDKVIALEDQWRASVNEQRDDQESLRRAYDAAVRHFLATYMEEYMLEAGRDAECVEASRWDLAHERHASRVLRHYRQRLYNEIHERLPYFQITPPAIDWSERSRTISAILAGM
ncbi:MAG: J domain-containing protein [Candidatus Hydrogenedentes bacterium]|nr:J domain-containing protein [Candidatus Hydrogenedentota bacterium]